MPLIWLLCACGGGGGSVGSTPAPSGQTTSQADNTAPVITLDGPATVEVVQGQSYNEAGATATDAVDGDVDVEISGEVDNQTIGTYTIRYSAVDQAGNEASVSRTVQVVAAHTSDSIELVVFANGMAGSTWDAGFGAYDQAIDYATCDNDNGSDCPSISWALASDADRGQVLEISRVDNDNDAGFSSKQTTPTTLLDLLAAPSNLIFKSSVVIRAFR